MTGTKQNYARAQKISIDRVTLNTLVLDDKPTEGPDRGAYVQGAFMEGARWSAEERSIVESRPKELYTTVPVMWFQPEKDRVPPPSQYYCPLYKTLARAGTLSTTGHSTNFVTTLQIPTNLPESHWIKRGVACVLGLS